jgi:hypothetical protein
MIIQVISTPVCNQSQMPLGNIVQPNFSKAAFYQQDLFCREIVSELLRNGKALVKWRRKNYVSPNVAQKLNSITTVEPLLVSVISTC